MKEKGLKITEKIIDNIFRIILIGILLIGIYFVVDTIQVFYAASNSREMAARAKGDSIAEMGILTDDYVAWLKVDGTTIDYPIMQGETNTAYLNTNAYGEYSLSGAIFQDYRNASDFSDDYNLIYGHHMMDGFMFGALDEFYDNEYLEEHKTGTLELKSGEIYKINFFACIKTTTNVKAIFEPSNLKALQKYLDGQELYKQPENNHYIALTTCVEPGSSNRTALLGNLELVKQ